MGGFLLGLNIKGMLTNVLFTYSPGIFISLVALRKLSIKGVK